MKPYDKVLINYRELAFIMNESAEECKDKFITLSKKDDVKLNVKFPIEEVKKLYKPLVSCFETLDGSNPVDIQLDNLKHRYKGLLKQRSNIKKISFTGGSSILLELLSENDLEHAKKALVQSHLHLFGKNTKTYQEYLNKPESWFYQTRIDDKE